MRRTAGIVALTLAIVACGGGGSSGGGDESPSPTEPGSGSDAPGAYETLRAMQLDVERAFILCNAPMTVYDPPEREGALGQADCTRDVTLLLYEPPDVGTYAAAIQSEADGVAALVFGTNWIITCKTSMASCEKIQGITGGELLAGTP